MTNNQSRYAAVICVGNKLMLDEGIGPAAYEYMNEHFVSDESVTFYDVGCMSLDMLPLVEKCEVIITVDAVDGTGEAPGTVFLYSPEDMARNPFATTSLHDLKLADLFDAASLLGYSSEGVCVGMQVENMSPKEYTIGLTQPCFDALPLLAETVRAQLVQYGFKVGLH